MKKILITGSSGMIGTRLFEMLSKMDYDVTGIDIKRNIWDKEIDNYTIKHDLKKKINKKIINNNFDFIIHLAANARVHDLVIKPDLALENILSTFNILEFARLQGVNKIVFSSSREVYGDTEKIRCKEDDIKINHCLSPYTASKITGESLLYSYKNCYGLDSIILRFSNVYGMYDISNRLIPWFIKQCIKNNNITIFGEEKLLDFTYIDDTVSGILKAIVKFDGNKNEVFNIASGSCAKIVDVAYGIKNLIGSINKISFEDSRKGEVIKFTADISKARRLLGYEPNDNIESGLQKTLNWYLQYYNHNLSNK